MRTLDLKNNKITLGELMDNPSARAVLQKRFPMATKHPITGPGRTITLEQVLSVAQPYTTPQKINEILNALRRA